MIKNSDIKDLFPNERPSMELYFEYIHTSQVNGQTSQVRKLIDEMNRTQRKAFLHWAFDIVRFEKEDGHYTKLFKQVINSL